MYYFVLAIIWEAIDYWKQSRSQKQFVMAQYRFKEDMYECIQLNSQRSTCYYGTKLQIFDRL